MACFALFSMATMGFGALCAVPLFLLFIPIGILVYSLTSQSMSAVLVDDLGVFHALQRAWSLIKNNIGVMALISIIIYFASLLVSLIYFIPSIIPMISFFSNLGTMQDPQAFNEFYRNMNLWTLVFSPLYMLLQGIFIAFSQSVWTLTYMKLTKSQGNDPVLLEANA